MCCLACCFESRPRNRPVPAARCKSSALAILYLWHSLVTRGSCKARLLRSRASLPTSLRKHDTRLRQISGTSDQWRGIHLDGDTIWTDSVSKPEGAKKRNCAMGCRSALKDLLWTLSNSKIDIRNVDKRRRLCRCCHEQHVTLEAEPR